MTAGEICLAYAEVKCGIFILSYNIAEEPSAFDGDSFLCRLYLTNLIL